MCQTIGYILLTFIVFLSVCPHFFNLDLQLNPKVLVISFDGFKYNYISRYNMRFLLRIRNNGTYTKYMQNVFETKTFPNHHSVATGFYPATHGVLGQAVYDPEYQRVLLYGPELWNYNDDIVPIWIHNQRSGQGRHSGVYMWPGSEFSYNNILPTFVEKYNRSVPWRERINKVINWFIHPFTPANLVMMYFEEPDFHSHRYGPKSPQVAEQMKKIDIIMGYLFSSLNLNKIRNVNIFFLSDHGMVEVPSENIINITDKFISPKECILTGSSPSLHVIPQNKSEDCVYNMLKEMSKDKEFKVYRQNELPDKWLYKNNRRIPPMMIIANEGHAFDDVRRYIPDSPTYGLHGYDNELENMHPFFLAYGPRIKPNYTIKPFNSVDLFSVFCEVLKLDSLPTNGSFENVRDMLINSINLNGNITSEKRSMAVLNIGNISTTKKSV